jgi:hypothetical protein
MVKLSNKISKAKEIIRKLDTTGDVSEAEADFMIDLLSKGRVKRYVWPGSSLFSPKYCEMLAEWYEAAGRILETSGVGTFITGLTPCMDYFHGDLLAAARKTISLMDPLDCPSFIFASQGLLDLSPERDAFREFLETQDKDKQTPRAGVFRKFGVYEVVKSFTSPKNVDDIESIVPWVVKEMEKGLTKFYLPSPERYEYTPEDCQVVAAYHLYTHRVPFADLLYHDYEFSTFSQGVISRFVNSRVFLSTKEACKKVEDIMWIVHRKGLFNVCLESANDEPDNISFIEKVHNLAMLYLLEKEAKEQVKNEDVYLEFER